MKRAKVTIKNIVAYCQGNIRYHLYYSKNLGWLMRNHVREQIDYRINSMNSMCYANGSCIECGCQTPHLQMSNKACEGNCYPRMYDSYFWKGYVDFDHDYIKEYNNFKLDKKNKKFIKVI